MGRGVEGAIGAPWRSGTRRRSGLAAGLALLLCAPDALSLDRAPAEPGPQAANVAAPPARIVTAPTVLQAELDALVAAFGEPAGVAVSDVEAGWTAHVAGDVAFPQESVSKLWVALTLLDDVDRGRFRLDDPVTLRTQDLSVFHQPIAKAYRHGAYATTLEDLLRRTIIDSDNAAADRLVRRVGGAAAIQATLARKGLAGILAGGEQRELQARIAGLEWRQSYGLGRNFARARARLPAEARDAALAAYLARPADGATPVAVVRALAALKRGELLGPASTARLIGLMTAAATDPTRLKSALPARWTLAHKTGTGQNWRGATIGFNDVGLITAPDGRTYAVAVMIRRTRKPLPAQHAFMQGVTAAVVRRWKADTGVSGAGELRRAR